MNGCKLTRGVLATVALGFLASGCAHDQAAARHYRACRDMDSFATVKFTVLHNGMPQSKIESLLGPGEELDTSAVTNLVSGPQIREMFGEVFPQGVRDHDVFLGYPVLGGRRYTVLQFREKRLVNKVGTMCLLAVRDMSQEYDGKRILVWLGIDRGLSLTRSPGLLYVAEDGNARVVNGGESMPWIALTQAFMAELKGKVEALDISCLKSTTYGRIIVDGWSWQLGLTCRGVYREVTVGSLDGWQANTQVLAEASCLTNIIGMLESQMEKMAEHPAPSDR
jgi:hypothetical protein